MLGSFILKDQHLLPLSWHGGFFWKNVGKAVRGGLAVGDPACVWTAQSQKMLTSIRISVITQKLMYIWNSHHEPRPPWLHWTFCEFYGSMRNNFLFVFIYFYVFICQIYWLIMNKRCPPSHGFSCKYVQQMFILCCHLVWAGCGSDIKPDIKLVVIKDLFEFICKFMTSCFQFVLFGFIFTIIALILMYL